MIWEQIRKNDSQEFLKMAALNNSENVEEEKPFGFCKIAKNLLKMPPDILRYSYIASIVLF